MPGSTFSQHYGNQPWLQTLSDVTKFRSTGLEHLEQCLTHVGYSIYVGFYHFHEGRIHRKTWIQIMKLSLTGLWGLIWGRFSSVQSLSHVQLFVTPWITARQASLSITISWSLPKLMSIKSVMPSSHLILCRLLLLLPPVPPSNRVFSNESTLCMRWPEYWSFSFNISGILTV